MPIRTEQELRELYGSPSARAASKVMDHIDVHARRFIEHSPFFVLATGNGSRMDTSPKGDPAGSVLVTNEGRSLLIGDRPGNNRIDGLVNILANPGVALLFLIPGVNETLRVNGQASIHTDEQLLDTCTVNGKRPITVLRMDVEEAFLHCAKSFMRSGLWEPDTWADRRPIPTMGEMLNDQLGGGSKIESESEMRERYGRTLY